MGQSVAAGASGAGDARGRLIVCLDLQQACVTDRYHDDALGNCRRILAHARRSGWPVVHVHRRPAVGEGGRPIDGLAPLPSEPLFYRSGVSAFSSRNFRLLVAGLAAELVIIGYSMSSSCLATAMVAYDHNLPVTLVEDAVSATPVDVVTREALEVVSRQIAKPFVALTSTGELLGQTRRLRVV